MPLPNGSRRADFLSSPSVVEHESTMVNQKNVEDLLSDEVKEICSAERQLTKTIRKMLEDSNDDASETAFSAHLQETRSQGARLEEIVDLLGIRPGGKKCIEMEGCIEDGGEAFQEDCDHPSPVLFGGNTLLTVKAAPVGERRRRFGKASAPSPDCAFSRQPPVPAHGLTCGI
jgi:hypothetical protein